MIDQDLARTLARKLIGARNGGPAVRPDDTGRLNAETAYAVQAAVAAETGAAGAFKTARKPGQPVIMAPIFEKDIARSRARFAPGRFGLIGIELEIGFAILEPLPPAGAAGFADKARRCVAPVAAIEIVDTRLTDIASAPDMLRLADNQLNGGLVVGEPVKDWQGGSIGEVTARLSFDGDEVLNGPAAVPGGGAFESFCALAQIAGSHCGGLQPGQVVITGSLNGMPFVPQGTRVHGRIEGIGEVSAQF